MSLSTIIVAANAQLLRRLDLRRDNANVPPLVRTSVTVPA
jgi:hypothetical protein